MPSSCFFFFGRLAAEKEKAYGGKKGKKISKRKSYPQDIHNHKKKYFLPKIFSHDKFFMPWTGMSMAGEEVLSLTKLGIFSMLIVSVWGHPRHSENTQHVLSRNQS